MSMENIKIEKIKEAHLHLLSEIKNANIAFKSNKTRILSDFRKDFFTGLVLLKEQAPLAYVIYSYFYSTWEGRVIYISDLWLNEERLDKTESRQVFQLLLDHLKEHCRAERINCINIYICENEQNKHLIELLRDTGGINMHNFGEWCLFEQPLFSNVTTGDRNNSIKDSTISIRRVTDIERDASQFLKLVHEMAIFEKAEECFLLTEQEFIEDFSYHPLSTENSSNRLYEALVVEKESVGIVGTTIYSFYYSIEKGRVCFLEEIYIRAEYRGLGVGSALWQFVERECMQQDIEVPFMQWLCLAWNTNAIKFYDKLGARNLTDRDKLIPFCYTKEAI